MRTNSDSERKRGDGKNVCFNNYNGDYMYYFGRRFIHQQKEVTEAKKMLYLDYERFRQNYLEAQRRYDAVLSEKERLFARTQPQAVRFDKESCTSSAGGSPFDGYLIEKERKCIDERLEEAGTLMLNRKELLKLKEQELINSRDVHDKIYRLRYILRWNVPKISRETGYSESHLYRILNNINIQIRKISATLKDDKK
ncbi:MAG: hypothetical protein NC485_13250 [Ruminococcus flavefaciens]|nr:hypothetical protein [Ruminococcus flavefaciens]MCM1060584.1 hypothetical protein [Eubacterium sp.]